MPKKGVKKESENKVKEKTIKKRSINKAINSSTNSSISESKKSVGRPRNTSKTSTNQFLRKREIQTQLNRKLFSLIGHTFF